MEYIIKSNHGVLTIDEKGYVTECQKTDNEPDGGGHLKLIRRFDLVEWQCFWDRPEEETSLDILDIGYWYHDPATNTNVYVAPDTDWRKEIAEILFKRKRADRIRAAAPKLLNSLEKVLDSLCYWLPRYGDPEIVNSKMVIDARAAIAEATGNPSPASDNKHVIKIEVKGGMVTDVSNLPDNCVYEINDLD